MWGLLLLKPLMTKHDRRAVRRELAKLRRRAMFAVLTESDVAQRSYLLQVLSANQEKEQEEEMGDAKT